MLRRCCTPSSGRVENSTNYKRHESDLFPLLYFVEYLVTGPVCCGQGADINGGFMCPPSIFFKQSVLVSPPVIQP